MNHSTTFDTFMRSAFQVEPASRSGLQIKAIAKNVVVQPGQAVLLDNREGQIAYIAAGATKLTAQASNNRQQIVAFHFSGDIFSVPAGDVHSYNLTSLSLSELLVFPARSFLDCAACDKRMARVLLSRQRRSLHRCRDKAVALGTKNAHERLCGFLIAMSERIGKDGDGRRTLDLVMSRRDIGDSLGLTIETVSRQLSKLRDEGLIETQGRSRLLLNNLAEIARRAGHFHGHATDHSHSEGFDLDQFRLHAGR